MKTAGKIAKYHNVADLEAHYATRDQQAAKIIAILQDYLGNELSNLAAVEIGCSGGGITLPLAKVFGSVIGIDVDSAVVQKAASQPHPANVHYLIVGPAYSLKSESFDVVVCTQVYEHTARQADLVNEIWRLLRPGGTCFFSGPNRLALVEPHYWLPFLSWLPHRIADAYMRLARRGPAYDIYPHSYWQLKRLLNRFKIVDYNLRILKEPDRFALDARYRSSIIVRRAPAGLFGLFGPFMPNFNWILCKPGKSLP